MDPMKDRLIEDCVSIFNSDLNHVLWYLQQCDEPLETSEYFDPDCAKIKEF